MSKNQELLITFVGNVGNGDGSTVRGDVRVTSFDNQASLILPRPGGLGVAHLRELGTV